MHIEELIEVVNEKGEKRVSGDDSERAIVVWDTKRVLVGVGARALFYPSLMINVIRNKIQSEFHWWDRIDEFILLGAVPFPADVLRLKALGVGGVVTLNEPYETLVPTSLYNNHKIHHLVIPTRDYIFAPSYGDICQAVEFVYSNALCGKITFVHCKAGRGRSTTIVLSYLVKYKQMTPEAAFNHIRSVRPRVRLACSQWQAVQDYYSKLKKFETLPFINNLTPGFPVKSGSEDADDGSIVLITESDLDGYEETHETDLTGQNLLTEVNLACRVQFASQAALARISCLWLRCHTGQKLYRKKMEKSLRSNQLETLGVDIHAY